MKVVNGFLVFRELEFNLNKDGIKEDLISTVQAKFESNLQKCKNVSESSNDKTCKIFAQSLYGDTRFTITKIPKLTFHVKGGILTLSFNPQESSADVTTTTEHSPTYNFDGNHLKKIEGYTTHETKAQPFADVCATDVILGIPSPNCTVMFNGDDVEVKVRDRNLD